MQQKPITPQRNLFDYLALKTAIDRDFEFMKEIILKNTVITHKIVIRLMVEKKYEDLLNLCVRASRPRFLKPTDKELNKEKRSYGGKDAEKLNEEGSIKRRFNYEEEKEDQKFLIKFNDVIECCLTSYKKKIKNDEIKKLVSLMDKQVTDIMKKSDEKYLKVKQRKELLDYKAIFALFVKQRNITLIRFLLTKQEFQRKWFIVALEEEAYDMAALLHKEFFRTILTNVP